MKRRIFILFLIIFTSFLLHAVLLLEENFNFTGNLTDNGWTAHSGSGTNPIDTTTGLTYSGYASSGIGNAALVDNNGEDDSRTYHEGITSGVVFTSFLVNVSSGGAPTGYFFHLSSNPIIAYRPRVFVDEDAENNLEFGLSMSSSTASGYTDNDYYFGTTYLLVIKYEFISGIDNDEVSLFVFTSGVTDTEPETPTLGPYTGTDATELGSVALRQYSSSQNITVDGIRIGTTWDDAPLPVTLSTFYAIYSNGTPTIYWTTESEEENQGWNIYRGENAEALINNETITINYALISGAGTTQQITNYQFIDEQPVVKGTTYWYWLESVDNFGVTEMHPPTYLTIPSEDPPPVPRFYGLYQNYPNPFNPDTEIKFKLEEDCFGEIVIYNMKGEKIRNLFKDKINSDKVMSVTWDGKDEIGKEVSSGLYFFQLETAEKNYTKKMLLVK
ncbi:MAG: T9SS type A sorting domain-containing protein [Candidatus Cloacimonetes bacterium]|nr:T9SS type A sorting domain-containing protein [Candidatus Cloacimonadota bacterium]